MNNTIIAIGSFFFGGMLAWLIRKTPVIDQAIEEKVKEQLETRFRAEITILRQDLENIKKEYASLLGKYIQAKSQLDECQKSNR